MQSVQDRHPALFSPAENTFQLFMWQPDIIMSWVPSMYIVACNDVHGALNDALKMYHPHVYQPWRLDRCNPYIKSNRQRTTV